jgi:hypothetical protein
MRIEQSGCGGGLERRQARRRCEDQVIGELRRRRASQGIGSGGGTTVDRDHTFTRVNLEATPSVTYVYR